MDADAEARPSDQPPDEAALQYTAKAHPVPDAIDLAPMHTMVPGAAPIRLGAYYPHMRSYYPYCEMQTKRWCVRNIGRDWRILDVGGNIGYYAVLFGRMAAEGRVVAFEPTETARMLAHNLEVNGVTNVEIRRLAMGETEGTRRDAIFRVWGDAAEVDEFPFSTVDAEIRALGWERLDLLKVDVDSFDLEVLKGSLQTLDRFNPWVLVELNHALAERQQSVAQALDWLASVGYREALVMDGENFLLRRPQGDPSAAVEGLSLRHDREPVFITPSLVATASPAASVSAEATVQGASTLEPETGTLTLDATTWGYGLSWTAEPLCIGPAIVCIRLEVQGADVGVLCVREGMSEVIGSEAFVEPGPGGAVEIALENVEELRGIVLRKGPRMPGVAHVKFSPPEVLQAEPGIGLAPPLSLDPTRHEVGLAEIARGLPVPSQFGLQGQLDIVEAHELGARLGRDFSTRPPIVLVSMPLSRFRMETHDSKILAQLYRMLRPARHLEFGTWEGFGARLCLQNCDAHVWTLNLPEGEKDAAGQSLYADSSGVTDSGSRVGRLYREAGLADRVTQLLLDSRDFNTSSFGTGFFDTVLIDGGHSADVVSSDTEKALQVVRPGGVLMWHDFCPDPTVLADQLAAQGVVEAVLTNWTRWRPQFSDLFWVRPSFILLGVVGADRPSDGRLS